MAIAACTRNAALEQLCTALLAVQGQAARGAARNIAKRPWKDLYAWPCNFGATHAAAITVTLPPAWQTHACAPQPCHAEQAMHRKLAWDQSVQRTIR